MFPFTTPFSTKSTPRREPIPGTDQVPNSAGGFTWELDDWARLERFLILGCEGGTFYIGERELTRDNALCVARCIAADGIRTIDRIVAISTTGRAPKNDPAIFSLAMAAKLGDDATRRAAYAALPSVCRTGTHLMHLAEYAQGFGGWGRGMRRAVGAWFKAIPYGVYDVADNSGFVNVGTDHDTPVFAVTSIDAWWQRMGSKRYTDATELFIIADAGGSNSYRARVWKFELQRLADKLRLPIHVSHFPPGTSKWNKIEHRLFSFITMNWRGKPLRTYETVVNLIGNTTNRGGLVVSATIDRRRYPTGKKVTPTQMRELKLEPHAFHGDWNYTIRPRPIAP